MRNRIRPYAWGSRTAIAELLGEPVPSPHPQAELWLGAHPGDPSEVVVHGVPERLDERIAADPDAQLGPDVTARYGGRLPFLLKVLAADQPLSLQAHPSLDQADKGFDAEDAAGIPVNHPNRNYKDRFHKPELICALTEFHALCGFRDPQRTVDVLAGLKAPELDHYLALLSGQPDAHGVRALFSTLMTLPQTALNTLLEAVLAAAAARLGEGSEHAGDYRLLLELGERYEGDSGVIAALMLNRVVLDPGQALYLPAGNLHAYLQGVGVELMANSDNVLRGGLTPKHVDVPELMRVLDFTAGDREVLEGDADGPHEVVYRTGAAEFELSRIELAGPDAGDIVPLPAGLPQVVLCTEGSVELADAAGDRLVLQRGQSAWIPASDTGIGVWGDGTVYRATVGSAEPVDPTDSPS
nr:mannose-6-phosphate isomerase, class I [Nakamurella deserti]